MACNIENNSSRHRKLTTKQKRRKWKCNDCGMKGTEEEEGFRKETGIECQQCYSTECVMVKTEVTEEEQTCLCVECMKQEEIYKKKQKEHNERWKKMEEDRDAHVAEEEMVEKKKKEHEDRRKMINTEKNESN